jgi:zinc-binding alcohol dehydrogenase family protein
MKAVGYYKPLPLTDPDSLLDLELADPPAPSGHDLLVAVKAVSVNPVDTKSRKRAAPPAGEAMLLGFDAAGVVISVGPEVSLFKPADAVYYAGEIERPGSNAQFQLVDERIVGHKPASIDYPQAAALPLTAITAWELLFDRLGVARASESTGNSLLIMGAAGGVGSILTQLARKLTGLTVIGTASRPETREWILSMGAHHVIDHSLPLPGELERIGIPQVTYAAGLTHTPEHFPAIAKVLAPEGKFALIDDLGQNDIGLLRRKSISFHWEYMFTRSIYQTPDMIAQHHLLDEVAGLIDSGILRTTMAEDLGLINSINLKEAHRRIETGKAIGKLVLSGWS